MITQIINFDIKYDSHITITAKQGDINARYLEFHLLDDALPFSLVGRTVRAFIEKPDKKSVFNNLEITSPTQGYCLLELTSQTLVLSGQAKLELVIYESGKKLSTIPIKMNIIKSVNNSSAIESSDEFGVLDNALFKIDTFRNEMDSFNSQLEQNKNDVITVNSRFDNIIANNNPTDGNTELIDMRVSKGGASFSSAGSHLRAIENGYIKNIGIESLSEGIYSDSKKYKIECIPTSAMYSSQKHSTIGVSLPISSIKVNKVRSKISFMSKSSFIKSIEQRFDISGTVKKGTLNNNTIIQLDETVIYDNATATTIQCYIWVETSQIGVVTPYDILDWVVIINDTIEFNIITGSMNLLYPFNVTGTANRKEVSNFGIINRESANNYGNIRDYLLGERDFNFNNSKTAIVNTPYATGNSFFGFMKIQKAISPVIKVDKLRLTGKFLSFNSIFKFEPVLELVDSNNSVKTITGQAFYPNVGEVLNFDYTFSLTDGNENIKSISIYFRSSLIKKLPHNFDIGDINIFINDSDVAEVGFGNHTMPFSQGSIISTPCLATNDSIKDSPLKGKIIKVFGDSIFDTSGNPNATPTFVASLTGATQINYAVASSGYGMDAFYQSATWGKDNTSVPKMIERSVTDGITPDYLLFGAGTNDWDFQKIPLGTLSDALTESPQMTTFYGALGLTIRTALKHYPFAKYLFVTPTPRNQPSGSGNQHTQKGNGKTVIDYAKAIIEVCNYFSMKTLHMTESAGFNLDSPEALKEFMPDGLHLSTRGAKERYAPRIIKALEEM